MQICLNASSTKRLPDGGLSRFQRWISSSSKSSGMLKFLMSVARFKTCVASKSSSIVFSVGLPFRRELRGLHCVPAGNPTNAVKAVA